MDLALRAGLLPAESASCRFGFVLGKRMTLPRRTNALHLPGSRRAERYGIRADLPKGNLSGYWSRRIDSTNRLVYTVDDGSLVIVSCRFHY
jgi:hypothetical protein